MRACSVLARILTIGVLPVYSGALILEYLARQGMEPFISTPDEITALIKADIAKFASIINEANIKIK